MSLITPILKTWAVEKHRQEIIYRGKPVGHLLSIEKNIFSDLDEIYAIPDVDYGMEKDTSATLPGKKRLDRFQALRQAIEALICKSSR